MSKKVLIFDTEKIDFEKLLMGLKQVLLDPSFKIEKASSFEELHEALIKGNLFDVVIVNFSTDYFRELRGKNVRAFIENINAYRSKGSNFFAFVDDDEYQTMQMERNNLKVIHNGNVENQLSSIFQIPIFTVDSVTIRDIRQAVSELYKISYDKIAERTRKRPIVQARQVTMFISRILTSTTLDIIAGQFTGIDHTTVIHSCHVVRDMIDTGEVLEQDVRGLMKNIAA